VDGEAPELLSNDPDGFAWSVLRERTPRLIAQIRDAHPYGPGQRRALDALLTEITSGTMRPLDDDAHDAAVWRRWGAPYFGKPWADVPFLWWESYFYRRLLGAIGFFEPGPWFWLDPFAYLKDAELHREETRADLAVLDRPADGEWQARLHASLWGNQADLSFRVDSAEPGRDRGMVVDEGDRLWEALGTPGAVGTVGAVGAVSAVSGLGGVGDGRVSTLSTVSVVADNAGRELLADLVLIDLLLRTDVTVRLHLKPRPYYVSDATTADAVACLRRLAAGGGEARKIACRLREAIAADRLTFFTHEFYCAPWSFHHMPTDLAEVFAGSSMTVMKGDLNYRRLTGDRAWPPSTPFAEVTAYFPGPVAALRTLKSDVVTGVDQATVSALDSSAPGWKTRGTHGLIQVRP
jgi:hypothetical protein